MNKNVMTVAASTLYGSYESPEIFVAEIHSEGVLCASPFSGNIHQDWELDNDLWS